MTTLVTTGPAEVRAILDAIGYPKDPDAEPDEPVSGAGLESLMEHAPQETLARMLGLTGAVALGDQLDRAASLARAQRGEAEAARHHQLSLTLANRRLAIRQRVERRYAQAFEGTRPLPDAATMLLVLQEHDAFADRRPETLVACAQKLGGRYRHLFGGTLAVVRRELHWLRDDAVRQLSHLHPQADALLSLDHVMVGALAPAAADAHRSLEAGVAQRFAERLMEAVLLLPEDQAPTSLEAWFKRRGWVARHLHDCRRLTWAILDLEWALLRGLVDAACGDVGGYRDDERPRPAVGHEDTPVDHNDPSAGANAADAEAS